MFWLPFVSFLFKRHAFVKDMTDGGCGDAGKNPTVKDRKACKGLLRHYRPTSSRIDIGMSQYAA